MSRLRYEEPSSSEFDEFMPLDNNKYHEPTSVHLSEDWDTLMEDFLDDFDDMDFPATDDEK